MNPSTSRVLRALYDGRACYLNGVAARITFEGRIVTVKAINGISATFLPTQIADAMQETKGRLVAI